MEHKKLTAELSRQISDIQKTDYRVEISQYYDLIKEQISADIREGYQDIISRNLTLGIGIHSGEYPKHLILNGQKEGWKYITRYLLWQEHILKNLFYEKEVASRSIGGIIGLALLWDMKELAHLARSYFQFLFENNRGYYQQKETHHVFMALLYDLLESHPINHALYEVLPEHNIYRRWLDHWDTSDESLLKDLLFELCDFHIYSSLDLKNKFSEILSLNAIPYEIRLIEKIRKEQGLTNLSIRHPLLETPIADIPETAYEWDLSKDEIYQFLLLKSQ